jgi:hypothetical protein
MDAPKVTSFGAPLKVTSFGACYIRATGPLNSMTAVQSVDTFDTLPKYVEKPVNFRQVVEKFKCGASPRITRCFIRATGDSNWWLVAHKFVTPTEAVVQSSACNIAVAPLDPGFASSGSAASLLTPLRRGDGFGVVFGVGAI